MHLRNYPQYFVKDGKRRAVYYTGDARDLTARGWRPEKREEKPAEQPAQSTPEPAKVEALPELVNPEPIAPPIPFDIVDDDITPFPVSPNFEEFTKAELLSYALERGVDLRNNAPKAEILAECKERFGG